MAQVLKLSAGTSSHPGRGCHPGTQQNFRDDAYIKLDF